MTRVTSERPSTLHAVVMWPFVEAIRRLGAPFAELPDLAAEEAAMSGRISHERASELLGTAVTLTGRADLGVLAAEAVEPGHFELVELATRAQRTVGEGLTTLAALVTILHEGLTVELHRGERVSVVRVGLRDGLGLPAAGWDFIVASLMIGGRRQTRIADLAPALVRLPCARPDEDVPLARVLSCPMEFCAAALEIEFPAELLDLPLVRANASMGQVLRDAGRDLIEQGRDKTGLAHAVREQLRGGLADGAVDAATLARKLHMSERTLRRRLDADGLGLRALTDQLRYEVAKELLTDPSLSTDELAARIGFTTAQAFHRAFRRWTGGTVQAFREQRGK